MSLQLNVLCLCSNKTADIIKCCSLVSNVHHVGTVDAFIKSLELSQFDVIVAALGQAGDDRSQLLQKVSNPLEGDKYKSKVFKNAQRLCPIALRIVFSHTACASAEMTRICLACGADAVVSTKEDFEYVTHQYFSAPTLDEEAYTSNDNHNTNILLVSPSIRQAREQILLRLSRGNPTPRIHQCQYWKSWLSDRINNANKLLLRQQQQEQQQTVFDASTSAMNNINTTTNNNNNGDISKRRIRVVHLSDTHHLHPYTTSSLPTGDILLHTGDICANYHHTRDLRNDLVHFLQWVHHIVCVTKQYQKVIFIAGNHDTLLDDENTTRYDPDAMMMLQEFLRNHPNQVSYLKESYTTYRGLVIYGSPTCVSRLETKNKRYLSNGFERWSNVRKEIWNNVPKNVDILLTHYPPGGLSDYICAEGDQCMKDCLYKPLNGGGAESGGAAGRRLPNLKLHAFGHDHDFHGLDVYQGTILSNGSQKEVIGPDPYGGGSPCVIDLVVPSNAVSASSL